MAVSAQALTLAQYAIMSNDPRIQQITWSLLQFGSILDDMPLINRKTFVSNGVRWLGSLPSVTWAPLNTEPTVTSGTPTPYQEQVYIIRNAIDVDRFLVEDENQIVDPRGAQADAYLQSVVYDVNDKFINNDHQTGDTNAPVGLRKRIDDGTTYGVHSDMKIDAGAVDLSASGRSAATVNVFLEYIDQMLTVMGSPEGDGITLYMSELMKRRFSTAVRTLGAGSGWNVREDAFGRMVDYFRGAKLRIIGRKADQTTQIITNTETSAGAAGSSVHTSIYGVKYGTSDLFGWQFEPLMPKDIGLIGNAGTVYRLLIDWAFGMMVRRNRSIGRLFGIKLA